MMIKDLAERHKRFNDKLESQVQVQAIRREHSSAREQLRLAREELRRWREGRGPRDVSE